EIANRFFDTPVGLLKSGYSADVIIADYIPQTPLTATNYSSHLLFGVNGKCITHTISSGKLLMKDREILIADEKALMAKSRELATHLWNKF
ncbi:MAG: putative aminohydrolase SsnA, partial [Cellulosilyticaceae bacterium]